MPPQQAGSVYDSFRQALPSLPQSMALETYRSISSSSESTINEDPVRAFTQDNLVALIDLGRASVPDSASSDPRLQQQMPQLERSHHLHTEADVLRASSLYLLHPVNVAATRLVSNGNLFCTSEQTSSGGARTDIRWVYHPNHGGKAVSIAVMEFKNTNVLRLSDFLPALTDQQHARAKVQAAFAKPGFTHLINNAYWLSKQAMKYKRAASVADVAIFDWNAMFVFDFAGMDEDAQVPVLAKGIMFQETVDSVNNGVTFRIVLLGFVVRALKRHGCI